MNTDIVRWNPGNVKWNKSKETLIFFLFFFFIGNNNVYEYDNGEEDDVYANEKRNVCVCVCVRVEMGGERTRSVNYCCALSQSIKPTPHDKWKLVCDLQFMHESLENHTLFDQCVNLHRMFWPKRNKKRIYRRPCSYVTETMDSVAVVVAAGE